MINSTNRPPRRPHAPPTDPRGLRAVGESDCQLERKNQSRMLPLLVKELADITQGTPRFGAMPPLDGDATRLGRTVIDSRQVQPNDVFWALRGDRHDGSDFIHEAFARGAAGAVTDRVVEPWAGRWSVQVPDAQLALWQSAQAVRERFDGHVIAVTGSVGKTSTREMIRATLSDTLVGTASPRNYNNQIGTPVSMLNWCGQHQYAVVELGANHLGEIDSLTRLCEPEIGVITSVCEAHLGEFGNLKNVARAKSELLSLLPEDGWAVLNGDNLWLRQTARFDRNRTIWVGRTSDCDVVANYICSQDGHLQFSVDGYRFSVQVWGRHFLVSALCAVAVGRILGLSEKQIARGLTQFTPVPQRCQVMQFDDLTLVDDTYNSSPCAVMAALDLLHDIDASGRRIVVSGDMCELGDSASYWHHKIGEHVVTRSGADLLIACGDWAEATVDGALQAGMMPSRTFSCCSLQETTAVLENSLAPGDVILVKGSRALKMEQVIEAVESLVISH